MMSNGDYGVPGSLAKVFADVTTERMAQDAMWGIQDLSDGTGPERAEAADQAKKDVTEAAREGRLTWRHILLEEVLEAFAEDDSGALRTELIQVAAVAVKWAQALDRRDPSAPPVQAIAGEQPSALHGWR
jgi:hypothetical protein